MYASESDTCRRRILLVSELKIGAAFAGLLKGDDRDVDVVESYGRHEAMYVGLRHQAYDVVVLTNTTLLPCHILEVIPEIQSRFPAVRIVVMSGWMEPPFVKSLARLGIRDVFRLVADAETIKRRIVALTKGEIRRDDLLN